MTRFLRGLSVAAVFAIATVIMAGPFCNFSELSSAVYPGDARLGAWVLAWDNHALLHGLPLFQANYYYPTVQSLAYNEHLFGLSLFTLPIFATTGNAVLGFNIVLLVSWFANGLAAYALIYRHVRDRLAAVAGGLIYAFSYYRMLHGHSHAHLVWAFLIPLSLIALERWFIRPTWPRLVTLTAAILCEVLTSWYMAVMVLLANALYFLCLWIGATWGGRRGQANAGAPSRRLLKLAGQSLVAVVATLPIVAYFARPYSALPAVGFGEAARYSANLTALLYPPLNTWMGRWLVSLGDGRPRWIWGETTLYLGAVAVLLAGIGIGVLAIPSIRRRSLPGVTPVVAVFSVALGAVALLLALGPSSAFVEGRGGWYPFDLFARVPSMASFRCPARFTELLLLSMALLGGAGATVLHHRFGWKGRLATILLIPVMLSEWYVVDFPLGKPKPEPIPPVYLYLATLDAHAVVSLPTHRDRREEWTLPADYLLYSTVHWHPIVNGFGRAEPPGYSRVISHMAAFPGPNGTQTFRALGVDYVVLHSARYPDLAAGIIAEALASPDWELVTRSDADYLFHLRPAPIAQGR